MAKKNTNTAKEKDDAIREARLEREDYLKWKGQSDAITFIEYKNVLAKEGLTIDQIIDLFKFKIAIESEIERKEMDVEIARLGSMKNSDSGDKYWCEDCQEYHLGEDNSL